MTELNDATIKAWISGRIGYGRLDAPFWLLGREELTADFNVEVPIRLNGPALDDLHAAHERLPQGAKWFGDDPSLQPTWHKLVVALLLAQGKPADEAAVRDYQAKQLGRSEGETLLMSFYPLPAMGVKGFWPYSATETLPYLGTRTDYESEVWLSRASQLQRLLREHKPKWILAYSKPLWPKFKRIFGTAQWSPIPMGPATWGEYAFAGEQRTLVTLAPDPTTQGSASKMANWTALGEFVHGLLKKD